MKKLIFIGLCLGFIFAAAETASAQFCKPNANQVAIFNDWRFEGACKILNPGNYPTPQSMGMPNDSITSIMVGANVQVELCADNDFQGACQTFDSNNDFLENTRVGNDNVSSLRIVMKNNAGGNPNPQGAAGGTGPFCRPNINQIAIFNDAQFGGQCKILNPGDFRTPQSMGMPNDSISSIIVGASVQVELCADDDFQGACQTFGSDNNFLGNTRVGNDNVSSLRIFRKGAAAGNPNPAPPPVAQQQAPPPPANLPPPTDEVIFVFKNKANVTNCTPNPGWAKCIQMAEPTIRIMATKAVSQSAMNGVANVYSEMMRRLGPKYPKNKLDTFIVHVTNAEPWSELINLAPIGMAYPQTPYERSGDNLRGYGNPDNLWITEMMICKTGVQTRRTPDTQYRSFDQVVHEFGHSLHSNYLTDQFVDSTFKFDKSMTPLESFPYRIQQWFRVPNMDVVPISPKEDSFMKGFFTARATFSCDGYKP
ncbi:MAG TPA: hypothetical protein PLP21_05235 [Pyrinomonadaceae bacterium]|nr:hypothetical protein [Acidobacteriota bacterium]HQZ95698.1 hypothetical protein [Pyrinomonadaceae bacterium]